MKCTICGKGMAAGVTLYRANKPGQIPADWRCKPHLDEKPPKDLSDVVEAIEDARDEMGRG